MLYRSKMLRVLWPEILMATLYGTPARTMFLTRPPKVVKELTFQPYRPTSRLPDSTKILDGLPIQWQALAEDPRPIGLRYSLVCEAWTLQQALYTLELE